MKRLVLAATLALSTSLPAALWAQTADTYENRLAAATAYTQQTMADMDMEAMIRTMYAPLLDQIRGQGQVVTGDQVAQIHALYMDTMLEPLTTIMEGQNTVMAELFTLEEITALAEFYNTPVGRSVMTKLPQMMERLQPQIMVFVQGAMPQLIPELQRILGG